MLAEVDLPLGTSLVSVNVHLPHGTSLVSVDVHFHHDTAKWAPGHKQRYVELLNLIAVL